MPRDDDDNERLLCRKNPGKRGQVFEEWLGQYQSFAKFFSKLGCVYDFPFREISREIRVVIWLFLPRNSSLGWEELGKSTVRDRNGQSPEKKMRFGPPGWPFSQEIEHFHQTIDKHD